MCTHIMYATHVHNTHIKKRVWFLSSSLYRCSSTIHIYKTHIPKYTTHVQTTHISICADLRTLSPACCFRCSSTACSTWFQRPCSASFSCQGPPPATKPSEHGYISFYYIYIPGFHYETILRWIQIGLDLHRCHATFIFACHIFVKCSHVPVFMKIKSRPSADVFVPSTHTLSIPMLAPSLRFRVLGFIASPHLHTCHLTPSGRILGVF